MDKHITFLSDDVTVKFVVGADAHILDMSGFASIETEHNVITNPFMPGSQTSHIHDKERFIPMQLLVPVARRSFYLHYFRVNSTGTVTIMYGDVERYSEYIVSASAVDQPTVKEDLTINLTLRCGYPYWKDVYGFGENLGEKVGLINPAFFSRGKSRRVAAYVKFDRRHALTNTGEVAAGIYVIMKTTETVKNPKIMLIGEGDKFIRVGTDKRPFILNKNDILEISTVTENGNLPGQKKRVFVRLNGENILNLTDQFSTFFQIEPGQHEIGYAADEGEAALQLWLYRNWAWSWV